MFEQITEDILIMVDGDDTYEASFVHQLLAPILRGDADLTVATQLTSHGETEMMEKVHGLSQMETVFGFSQMDQPYQKNTSTLIRLGAFH